MKEINYSVSEARLAAENNKMDIYHKELILWLCDEIDRLKKSMNLLEISREYVQRCRRFAEARHDNPGEFYMDYGMYEIMVETGKLLDEIDEILK